MNASRKRASSTRALKIILPLLLLAIGMGGLLLLSRMKSPPRQQPTKVQGVLVEVQKLVAKPYQVRVQATGTVQADRQISLVPEVSGRVVWISPDLVNGGLFAAGEPLLRVDPADYRLAVERARAEVARAEVSLASEQERARVARSEWQRVRLPDKGEPGPLVTREIQLRQEQANLAAARAGLSQAELNLQRTEIKAPFNGRIRNEQVDLGQYLRSGTGIAGFAGTDRAEVHVPLPVEDLKWLQVPGSDSGAGSVAQIRSKYAPRQRWQGTVVRSLGEIDPASRMATLVVAIEDPYRLKQQGDEPKLENGLFVELELLGRELSEVISIPRAALRDDNHVWLVDEDNRLRLRPVEVLRRSEHELVIASGLNPGERLVLTQISGAADGLLLRPRLLEGGR